MKWPDRIWVIGCGNMGGAILQSWLDEGGPAENFTVIDPNPSRLPAGLIARPDFPTEASPDLVLLAVKPQTLGDIKAALAKRLSTNSRIISILAGVETGTLEQAFPEAKAIVRLVPNMAVTVGKSPMIMFSGRITDRLRAQMQGLFQSLGETTWVNEEDHLHIATALSGSGPAFVFRYIDALASAASELGLGKDQAAKLALTMVEGAAILASQSKDDPGALADRVASPGGTTRRGLDVLDADGRVNRLVYEVLNAATDRSREMAQEAKR